MCGERLTIETAKRPAGVAFSEPMRVQELDSGETQVLERIYTSL